MKYYVLCGGEYGHETPRQLWRVGDECILDRTMRLLYEGASYSDVIVVTNNPKIIDHCDIHSYQWVKNPRNTFNLKSGDLHWAKCFDIGDGAEPCCFIFGDVYFTEDAIGRILYDGTHRSATFFASAPPFSGNYIKPWAEPFAFKVYDRYGFNEAASKVLKWQDEGKFSRVPIAWEVWYAYCHDEVLRSVSDIDYSSVCAINDGTCDVDSEADLRKLYDIFG